MEILGEVSERIQSSFEAHVAAIGNPKASNQRIIVSGGYYTYAAMIGILQKYNDQGEEYAVGPDDSAEWCKEANENGGIDSTKAKDLLGLKFRSFKDAVVDTARQLKEMIKTECQA
ncbi:hypothetical protein V1506DRAFT_503230 [Lipomyces tetrasporus]